MIVLGKNKINENYNISDDGIIIDLNGNVQELKVHQGYLEFKGIGVHKIQMWTKFSWCDGRKFVIHHIDENKLNNNISNLQILTHEQHTFIHKKGKSWIMSEEGRNNISKAVKGKNNPMYGKTGYWLGKTKEQHPMYGKHISLEHKKRISEFMKEYWKKRKGE